MSQPNIRPLKLLSNRVNRSYQGGMLIESWQSRDNPKDNAQPEDWLASLVEARNSVHIPGEGLSTVEADGAIVKLTDLVMQNPEFYLGRSHVEKYGTGMAVLTKVLDASVRLSIQVHPTKAFAREYFKSDYGKTEAWYIIGGREIDGERPYVLAGFKPGITREMWRRYFEEQDIDAMINALHRFYIKPGDVVLIEGGLPHTIGGGCFLIEIQEPTDYTMRVERKAFNGGTLPDNLCHQGLGFGLMLDCFNYDTLTEEETYKKCFKTPSLVAQEDKNKVECLIGEPDTRCFVMNKLSVATEIKITDASFKTCIVISGAGYIMCNDHTIEINQGESYFFPANLDGVMFINSSTGVLEIILCYPPK